MNRASRCCFCVSSSRTFRIRFSKSEFELRVTARFAFKVSLPDRSQAGFAGNACRIRPVWPTQLASNAVSCDLPQLKAWQPCRDEGGKDNCCGHRAKNPLDPIEIADVP